MYRLMYGCLGGWIDECLGGWVIWMDRGRDVWVGGMIDGCLLTGWTEGWMSGWVDRGMEY